MKLKLLRLVTDKQENADELSCEYVLNRPAAFELQHCTTRNPEPCLFQMSLVWSAYRASLGLAARLGE